MVCYPIHSFHNNSNSLEDKQSKKDISSNIWTYSRFYIVIPIILDQFIHNLSRWDGTLKSISTTRQHRASPMLGFVSKVKDNT